MANEFIIKNGFVSKGNSIVEGILSGQTFNLINTPVNNNSATEILVRNSTTGVVEYRDSSTLSGGGGGQTITGYTYDETTNKFSIELSGGTSFDTTIDIMSGLTINGNLFVSGDTSVMDIKEFGVIISGDTVFAAGQMGTQDLKVGERGISDKVDIGGDEIIIDTDTLNLQQTLSQNNTETQLLVRNSTTGNVEYRDSSTLSGGGGGQTITGYTYDETTNKFSIELSGGTSFDATINVVSGLTVTNDLIVSGNTGIGTDTPSQKLHVEDGEIFVNHNQNANTRIEIKNVNTGVEARASLSLTADGLNGFETGGVMTYIGDNWNSVGTFQGIYLPNSLNITTGGGGPDDRAHINIGPRATTGETRFFSGGDDFDNNTLIGRFFTSGLTTTDDKFINTDRIRIRGGAVNGYVLTSDADGIGTWAPASGSSSTNTFVSGGTYDSSTSEITFTNTTGGTFNVDLSSLSDKTSFTVAGDNGTPFTITSGDTLTFEGSTGIDIGVAATDRVLIAVDYSGADSVIMAATNGTGITVDGANDKLLIYDNDTATVKYINANQLPSSGAASTPITGYSYNPASNTFTIGLSGGTSFDSQILEVSGITVNGDIIQTGTTSVFSNGEYLEIGTGFANTGQLTFNANHDGGVGTNTYTPVFAGNANAGMTVIKMPSGGNGGLDFYVKNHGTTSGSQNLSTFTKILELNQDGNSTFGGELDILSGLTLSQTPTLNNSETAILVRNNSTGEVEYREASTLTGSTDTNTFVTGGTLSTDSLLTLGYNNGGFANPIDLSTLMDGGDTITGFTYDKNTNTFSIGVSGKTSFDSQILKVSGITVENSMELGEYIVHSGDTNTYFGFNGTDSIVAFTNASRKLRIGTNAVDLEYNGSAKLSTISNGVFIDGRVGVGTDSPQQSLDVRGNVLLSNPGTTTVLTLSGSVLNATYIDFDNTGASTPFARVEGRTYGGGTSGSLNFDTFPSGGALSQVMILTNNQRVGIGDLGNNDVEELLHVEGGDLLVNNTSGKFFTDIENSNGPVVKMSGASNDVTRYEVNLGGDGSISLGIRGKNDVTFPGFGKQNDSFLYSSNANNGLNILSTPGTGTDDYIRFYAGKDANGNTPDLYIQGSGLTKGNVGINTELPEEKFHVEGGDFLISNTQRFYSVLNTNTPLVRFSGQTDDLTQLNVATYNGSSDSGIGMVSRGYSEASFPGYGKQGDGSLYSSIAQNGLNIISAPGTDTEDYIRFFAGTDADGNTANMFIAGTGSTKGFIGINTETPTERLHIAGSIRIVDGTEQNGYVLTCDANGVGSWQPSSGGTTGGTVYWETENGGLKSNNQNAGSINGTSTGSVLVGGYFNSNNIYDSLASTIINGGSNTISGSNASSIVSTNNSNIITQGGLNKIEYSVIMGGSSNDIIDTINDSDRSVIIGGTSNDMSNSRDSSIIGSSLSKLNTSTNGGLLSTTSSTGTSIVQSVILGGSGHNINGVSNSGIIGGTNNTLTGDGSVILGGQSLNGTANNTVYVPNLNINSIGAGTPIGNLGFDSSGNVVTGTTGSGSTTSFWEESGSSNEVLIDKKGSSSYTVNGESLGAIIAAGTGHTLTNTQYGAFLGGISNKIINSSSLIGSDVQIGGLSNIISGFTGTHYGNINIGGSSNLMVASAYNTMLSTSDSRIFGGNNNFIIGGGNHKNGIDGYGLYQNTSSGIIGGANNTFANGVDRSVIIGGNGLSATTDDTVYVPNLNINSVGAGTPIGNLGFDSSGNVVTGTSGGAAFSWSDPVVTSGNTNADCIDDLYVTNLHSCSPLFINPANEGDVYFGSSSGVTIQTASAKLGIGTTSPISKLHVNNGDILLSNENATLSISSTTVGGSGEYENRINFKSAGSNQSDDIDAQIRTESNGTRSNLFFGTIASNTLRDQMILTGRGRLGLGTMNPDSTLHISGSGIQQINVVSSNNNATLKLKSDDGNNAYIDFEETSGNRWLMGTYSVNDKFVWATGNTFSTGGLMALTQDGDLGVGNISPSSRLHVNISSLPSLPTLGNDNVALFESDNETEVAIVGTEDRNVFLKFGDENVLDGVIAYDNLNKSFTFQTDGINVLSLNTEQVLNQKQVVLKELGVGDPMYTLHVSRSGSTPSDYTYNIVSGNTGLNSGSCISEFWVTNLESCSPLHINTQNQGDIYFGDQGGGVPTVTLDITTAGEPGMYFGEESFIRYNETQKELIIGEDEAGGKVKIKVEGDEVLDVEPTRTVIRQGDLESEEGNIIIKSGNSKSLIVEDIPDVGGANLGTDVDGKLIDIPSDSRVKDNVIEIPNVIDPLQFIQNVKGYQFEFKPQTRISKTGKKHYGFKVDDFRDDLIPAAKLTDLTPAEVEINNIARTFVKKCKTRFNLGQGAPIEVDAMNYQDLIPFMIEGIKQLDTNINNINSGSNKFVTTQTLSSGQNTINHNLNDENVIVQVIEVGTGQLIIPDRVSRYLPNSVAINVEIGGEYKIIIMA